MSITADQITIAITVYNRREYLHQAIRSALNQTVPVRVIVVEDCGPDPTLKEFATKEFGSKIEYIRNPRRRGLFGNWNACLELCQTPWLSILHDDDYLAPQFIATMLELSRAAPDCALFFGLTNVVDDEGKRLPGFDLPVDSKPLTRLCLEDALWTTPLLFPGQLLKVESALAVGGFRETSQYCGDWEMWSKLIARFGASRAPTLVSYYRHHGSWERGTNTIARSGRQYPLSYVQRKRVIHLLRRAGKEHPLDRRRCQERWPVPARLLLRYGCDLSERLFAYHWRLFKLSKAPSRRYAAFQFAAELLGARGFRAASWVFGKLVA